MSGVLGIVPRQLAVNSGAFVAGAKLFVYDSGTTTKRSIYTTSALSIAHSNPLVADSNGRFASFYINPSGGAYKLTLASSSDSDPPASPLWTDDAIPAHPDVAVSFSVSGTLTAGGLLVSGAGSASGLIRFGAGADDASGARTVVITQDGAAYLGFRDSTNNTEAYIGTDSAGSSYGTISNHPVDFYTNSTLRLRILAGGISDYADDAAAASGGVPVGGLYRSTSTLKVRVS